MTWLVSPRLGSLVVAAVLVVSFNWVSAQQRTNAVAIDADDIGGVVTSAKGPEAGVWVIAETTDLPAKFARIVVTDDQGRYVVPDLPSANYQVWVRGYGLVDSPRTTARPGRPLDLKAVIAPDGRAAAQVYPANYWLSLLEIPKGEHPPEHFALETKACFSCHQVGTQITRELTRGEDTYASTLEAWDRHMLMGPNGGNMGAVFKGLGSQRKAFADWTDRIAAGAYPETPPRPAGVERNLVISMWDWALPTSRRSDAAGTDERTPTLNANGPIYGAMQSSDILAVLDPRTNTTTEIKIPSNGPVLDANTPRSPVWADEKIWKRQSDPRSVAMDAKGRVFVTARIRDPKQQPAYCTDSTNKFAKYFPMARPERAPGATVRPEVETVHADRYLLCRGPQRVRRSRPARPRSGRRGWLDRHRGVRQNPRCGCLAGMVSGRGRYQRGRQDFDGMDGAEGSDRSEARSPDRIRVLRDRHQPDRWQHLVLRNRPR